MPWNFIKTSRFPSKSGDQQKIKTKIDRLGSQLSTRKLDGNFGSLYTTPHPLATYVWKKLVEHNPGNLGFWAKDPNQIEGTRRMEYEVIKQMVDLYKGKQQEWYGYISSGATESNIFSAWLGRKYLYSQGCPKKSIYLLRSCLTHYSVRKAADVCDLKEHVIPIDSKLFRMSISGFEEEINKLYRRGVRGFLVCLTHGYTVTGTSDGDGLMESANLFRKKFPDSFFYFWIDAALNGLIMPFVDMAYQPLSDTMVGSYVVDFHKIGLVPYPGGIILFRKELLPLVEKPIEYLTETDATLLGSRPGIAAAAIWAMIEGMGREGFTRMVEDLHRRKEKFVSALDGYPGIEVVTDKWSLTCGLRFPYLKDGRLPPEIESDYGLHGALIQIIQYPNTQLNERWYKCYFLPPLNDEKLHQLVDILLNL